MLLDFGVMAPLPHGNQRPATLGSGFTDLLGIAPGAQYRLVVPSDRRRTIRRRCWPPPGRTRAPT